MNPVTMFIYKDLHLLDMNLYADMIHAYHLCSILFIYFGWLISPKYLWIYILYVGFTLLSWQWNVDVCPITQAEYSARGWDINKTPSFTQLFIVRPFLEWFSTKSDDSVEIIWTNRILELIKLLLIIAIIRWVYYIIML